MIMRLTGAAVLNSVFAKMQKEDGMPERIMILRTDRAPEGLRELASKNRFRDCRHRLRAIALAVEGEMSRAEVAGRAGAGAQTLCDRAKRHDGGGVDGLRDDARPGRPPKPGGERTAAVASWLEAGPDPEAGAPCRWTAAGIRDRIMDGFGVRHTVEGARRLMLRLGFRHVSPRPVHPKADPQAREEFRKGFAQLAEAAVPDGASAQDVLVLFRDEARTGRKGMLSRVRARKGTRPRVVRGHRCGCACPETGAAVGHVCAKAGTGETDRHLREIGERVPAGRHAPVVLDGAGWHRPRDLEIPDNVSLLRLPPCSPEPDPVETVFPVLKRRHFASRAFESAEHVRETVEEVRSGFARRTEEIMRITAREWAVP